MWRLGRKKDTKAKRITGLEADRDQAQGERDELRRKLDALLAGFAAAGASVESAAPDAVPGVPPGLLAAVRSPRPGGEPVKVEIPGGRDVIATVTGDGDPRRWMEAISEAATG